LPGLFRYAADLGCNVEIMVNGSGDGVFSDVRAAKIWKLNRKTFVHIMENCDFSKYHCLIFNSKRVYTYSRETAYDGEDIFKYFSRVPVGENPNIYMQHHLDFWDECFQERQICLANPAGRAEFDEKIVNCHWFGNVKITPKNSEFIYFITVGALDVRRKNGELLLRAVKKLHNNGIRNFAVTVIGDGKLGTVIPELQKYFHITGRVDFPTLYRAMEKADYYLPLLDPEKTAHERYMKYGTSGSFQLICGFQKPCLIHRRFADIYGLTEKDSFVYDSNEELFEQMISAINCPEADYAAKQENLKNTAGQLYQVSKNNLAALLLPEQA
jgi:hypothetical protein